MALQDLKDRRNNRNGTFGIQAQTVRVKKLRMNSATENDDDAKVEEGLSARTAGAPTSTHGMEGDGDDQQHIHFY